MKFINSDFDSIAKWYDSFLNQIYFNLIYRHAERMIAPQLSKKGKFLDIGCGTGNWLVHISEQYKNLDLYGVDKSQGMLAVAAGKNQNIQLKTGLAEKLPFSDEEFENVFMIEALHHFDDQAQSIQEAARVIKRGGHLFLVDPALNGWSGILWRAAKILPFERSSRFFSNNEAISLIQRYGLEIIISENKLANNWIIAKKN